MEDFMEMTDEQFAEMGKQHEAAQAQARDEQGRFVAAAAVEEVVEPTDEPDEIVYRRVIDLGDGSGTQVFEGETPEDLIEKLATAQEHATRKIRELTAVKKTIEQPVKAEVSADDEWLASQELIATPHKALDKMLEKTLGTTIEEFKADLQDVRASRRERRETQNAEDFVKSHPEFVTNEFNSGMMQSYLKNLHLEGTPENIERAFTTLSQGGLLQLKADDSEPETPGDTTVTPSKQRIAAPAGVRTVVIQKKAASGLSAKRSIAPSGPTTTQDLYAMSDAEFFKLGGLSKQDNW